MACILLYYHPRRVLFTYMEDTRAIKNPVYDTNGAYPESKEDEVMQ